MIRGHKRLNALIAFAVVSSIQPDFSFAQGTIRLAQAEVRATQARLKSAIEKLQAGSPNYDEMEPMLRAAVQNQMSAIQPRLQSMGRIVSIEFMGEQNGQDIYNVKFANGALAWGIQLSPSGKILALYFT